MKRTELNELLTVFVVVVVIVGCIVLIQKTNNDIVFCSLALVLTTRIHFTLSFPFKCCFCCALLF